MYKWQSDTKVISAYSDSDWAGCSRTRRSTSGGVIMRGDHLLTHWASTQATVALSVAEAELNAIVKAASEALGLINMYKDMNQDMAAEIFTDSNSAKGISQRRGCGKVKHLEARQLWIQEVVANKTIKIIKIPRAKNPSDAMTHHWLAVEGDVHFPAIGLSSLRPVNLSVSDGRLQPAIRGGV